MFEPMPKHQIKANDDQIAYTVNEIKHWKANRGKFDGDLNKKFFGILGETVVADRVKHRRPNTALHTPFDLSINGKKWDIKVKFSNSEQEYSHHVCVPNWQIRYPVDYYLFLCHGGKCSDEPYQILGYISKPDFMEKSIPHEEGDKGGQSDAPSFAFRADSWQLEQRHLMELKGIKDMRLIE